MIIIYHDKAFFKITLGDTTLALNPPEDANSFGANVVCISVRHEDMNGYEAASRGDAEPFVIDGPGSYEVEDIIIRGFSTSTEYGGASLNTAYIIQMEDMRLCYLGALNTLELPKEFEEELEEVDVLFVPVGAKGVFSAKDAHKLSVRLEPRIVIPMLFTKKDLDAFLKEEGGTKPKPVDKLTLKHKDLAGKQGDIVIVKAQ